MKTARPPKRAKTVTRWVNVFTSSETCAPGYAYTPDLYITDEHARLHIRKFERRGWALLGTVRIVIPIPAGRGK